jgi:hypothetical protein
MVRAPTPDVNRGSAFPILNDTGKIPGYAGGSAEEARSLAERGFRYLTVTSDVGLLAGAGEALRRLR